MERKETCKLGTKIAINSIKPEVLDAIKEGIEHYSNKTFDRYLIAYIDFLGSKERMKSSSNCYEPIILVKTLIYQAKINSKAIQNMNHIEDFVFKVFSDNIVIAIKINEDTICSQIISMINLLSLLQFEAFFQFDFPLRGGITIGELYIDDMVVWGTGLINAYRIESILAHFPRIIVSQEVIDHYEKGKNKELNLFALIKQDADGYWFIDYFMAAPNLRLIPELSVRLKEISLSHSKEDDRVKQKINWIISYFNNYCHKFKDRGDYEKCTIPYI